MIDRWKEEIREFYRNNTPELPPNYKHRYFKFVWKYPVQTAIHVRDRIKSPEHLARLAIKFAPQHVYYSLTTWLDPTTVRGRSKDAVPLWSDLVFDVDADDLDTAKRETKKLVKYLRSMGYRDIKVLFSGHKGFHVYVRDFKYDKYPEDHRERARYFEKVKKKIHEEILSEGIQIDPNLWDLYRVVRVPYTLNATSMLPAVWVRSLKHIDTFARSVKIQKKYPDKPVRLYSHTVLISSHVMGTSDRHVLFLDYDRVPLMEVLDEITTIQHRYNLHLGVLFETNKGFNVWFLDALPLRRILRIKKNTKDDPMHYRHIKRYGYDVARVWKKVFDTGEIHDEPKPIAVLQNPDEQKYPLSLGHLIFLNNTYRMQIGQNKYTVGLPKVKILMASYRIKHIII